MNKIMTVKEWDTWVEETWTQCVEEAEAMTDKQLIDSLYEELIYLDEQAGCFDEDTNARIDEQRRKLMIQILELEVSAA
jgi:hypothetical protein